MWCDKPSVALASGSGLTHAKGVAFFGVSVRWATAEEPHWHAKDASNTQIAARTVGMAGDSVEEKEANDTGGHYPTVRWEFSSRSGVWCPPQHTLLLHMSAEE